MPLSEIARAVGTPTYVYSAAARRGELPAVRRRVRAGPASRLLRGEGQFQPDAARKARGSSAREPTSFRRESSGRAWSRASPPTASSFRASGRRRRDPLGGRRGILAINAESEREIEKIEQPAPDGRARGARGAAGQPGHRREVAPLHLHRAASTTSSAWTSAGAPRIFEKATSLPGVRMTGIQAHIGSQILDAAPLGETAAGARGARPRAPRARVLDRDGRRRGRHRASRDWRDALSPEDYAAAVLPRLAGLPGGSES